MKRREFLQGMVVAIAALVLPPGKAKPAKEYEFDMRDIAASAGRQSKTHYLDKDIQLYEQVKMAEAEPEMLFGRPIVYTDALPDIGGDIVLGDLSAYIEGTLIKRIPVSQEILDDCIAGGDAWRGVRLSEFERTILDGDA